MLDQATYAHLRAVPAPGPPVAKLVVGKPVEEAADLLPRLFNLCRVAQGVAARAAFGLPVQPDWQEALRREILREHVAKLCLKWPRLMSRAAAALPRDWLNAGQGLRKVLFGPSGRLAQTPEDAVAFLSSGNGVAPLLDAISKLYVPGEACRGALPAATPTGIFDARLQENSVASRVADHPVMLWIERNWGRGPFWSAAAVAYDLEALLDGHLPKAVLQTGRAVVPAARGLYGITAEVSAGHATAFARVTPTDHLLASGGSLDQCLRTLRPAREPLAPLLLAILDPCTPVRLVSSDA